MSKCNIFIKPDSPTDRYVSGDVIRGVVTVMPNATCKCNELNIELGWRTHGRGNRSGESPVGRVLFRGEWNARLEVSYPFELTVPDGPHSYHGHYLNVDWFLRARADIPWAIDPKCEQDLLLERGPMTDPKTYVNGAVGVDRISLKRAHNHSLISRITLLVWSPFIGIGLLTLAYAIFIGGIQNMVLLMAFGGIFAAVGLAIAYRRISNKLASMKLGEIRLDWPEQILSPGDSAPLTIHMNAAKEINDVSATLICREVVVSGSGTNTKTYREDVFSAPIELQRTTAKQTRMTVEGAFRLPEDASPSFYAEDNELSWLIALHIDVAKWPDWKRELYLDVRPGHHTEMSAQPPPIDSIAPKSDAHATNGIGNTEAW